ncbi:DUF6602 domain-containing protein [Paraburkholderia kirstenboschensis]|uniref:DUF6602 domain-containing protein n=1 Tax=Paraburkholderia kirstenboschensis TaxID=1245436 RepID=A0ABZ0ES92_9BURK|nr:DUF6602 domain-containing protein [Paraburkholderia kirstenboschensis]WOD19102.1 DUF6602 domain-containing protein [Paraburkholderia kirstenboschensis]
MKNDDMMRNRYFASKMGDLTSYAGMVGDEFSAKVNRLAQLIGDSHEPSVGRYKESLLRHCIEQFIPKRYSVGTGSIAFTQESHLNDENSENVDLWNLKEHYVSQQLDIVIFDDHNFPPIFRDAEFVVVRPESVRAVVEVKGYLTKKVVIETVDGFLDLARKWHLYSEYTERWGRKKLHSPCMQLMGWDVYVDKAGAAQCDGETLRRTIVDTYRKRLTTKERKERPFPLLSGAYIYDDCIVNQCGYSTPTVHGHGYSTDRGRFIRYDEDRQPFLDRDATISSLLASIYVHLETPFNPDFVYPDQSMTRSVLPNQHSGITDLISGNDIDFLC